MRIVKSIGIALIRLSAIAILLLSVGCGEDAPEVLVVTRLEASKRNISEYEYYEVEADILITNLSNSKLLFPNHRSFFRINVFVNGRYIDFDSAAEFAPMSAQNVLLFNPNEKRVLKLKSLEFPLKEDESIVASVELKSAKDFALRNGLDNLEKQHNALWDVKSYQSPEFPVAKS
ncbi:MAG: hypothetical protein K8R88_11840 [Armatimonadetes bacterium]|nr:hypothetical protein [Armatimonadota bacterium]